MPIQTEKYIYTLLCTYHITFISVKTLLLRHNIMCKIANFAGHMEGHNLNKIDGFLESKDYI